MGLNLNKIRKDFPIFDKKIKGKPIVYLDSACTTLKPIQVINKVNEYNSEYPVCGERSAHSLGRKVSEEVYNCRRLVQKFIGAKKTEEIIFTKNATESINLVANSLDLKQGDIVLISDKEHNSGLIPFQLLKNKGVKLETFEFGNLKDFQTKLGKKVKLVSFVHTSNLDGTSNPAKEIIKLAHSNGSLVLMDGAQSVPHREVNVSKLDVDFLAFSGHKMLGPSATGVLYGKFNLLKTFKPFIIGGGSVKNSTYESYEIDDIPARFEAGLQNYSGIIGLGEAIKYIQNIGLKNIEEHEYKLNKIISEGLNTLEVKILGDKDPKNRSGIISFNIKGLGSHEVAEILNESANVMIRSGMHCVHSWFNKHKIEGSARVSLYFYNTEEECRIFLEEVSKIAKLMK